MSLHYPFPLSPPALIPPSHPPALPPSLPHAGRQIILTTPQTQTTRNGTNRTIDVILMITFDAIIVLLLSHPRQGTFQYTNVSRFHLRLYMYAICSWYVVLCYMVHDIMVHGACTWYCGTWYYVIWYMVSWTYGT